MHAASSCTRPARAELVNRVKLVRAVPRSRVVCIAVQVFMPDKIEDKRFLSPQERRAVCDTCLGIPRAVEGVIDIEELASPTLAHK